MSEINARQHNIRWLLKRVRGLNKAKRQEVYAYARMGGYSLFPPIAFMVMPDPLNPDDPRRSPNFDPFALTNTGER